MKSLREIQQEQKEWSDRNFGPQSPERMIFGMMEELGELAEAHLAHSTTRIDKFILEALINFGRLCHLHLKKQQGIRNPNLDFPRHIASHIQVVIDDIGASWYSEDGIPKGKSLENEIEKRKDSWADLMIFGLGYLNSANLGDADEILNAVWEIVRKRNWKQNPIDGSTTQD